MSDLLRVQISEPPGNGDTALLIFYLVLTPVATRNDSWQSTFPSPERPAYCRLFAGSRPSAVLRNRHVSKLTLSDINRTAPSHIVTFTPPGCRLRAAIPS